MGGCQAEQPMLGKVGVGPAVVVFSTPPAFESVSFAQNAAQAHSDPSVKVCERVFATVLEVREPAHERLVQIGDDNSQTCSIRPFRFLPHGVLQLLQAFLPRTTTVASEVVAQESKTVRSSIDDA